MAVKLASLLSTRTFSLQDERVTEIIGNDVPQEVRERILSSVLRATDMLWERVSERLLLKFGNFEKAFRSLDEDGSGALDRAEFVNSYLRLFQDGQDDEDDDDDDDEGTTKSHRQVSGVSSVAAIVLREERTEAGLRADAEVLFDMMRKESPRKRLLPTRRRVGCFFCIQ